MEFSDVEQMKSRVPDISEQPARLQQLIRCLEAHIETGEPVVMWFYNEQDYADGITLLELQEIDGSKVVRTGYLNSYESYYCGVQNPGYSGRWSIGGLLNNIADNHAMACEFVNDYIAYVTLSLDDETCITFMQESRENELPCEHCDDVEIPTDDPDEIDDCGHARSYSYYDSWAFCIFNAKDLDDHRPEEGHVF